MHGPFQFIAAAIVHLSWQAFVATSETQIANNFPDTIQETYRTRGPMDFSDELKLMEAAKMGRLEEVKLLIEEGVDIRIQDAAGYTPMHWAAYKGHLDVLQYLAEQGADVNDKDLKSNTLLHVAASKGHLDVIKFLTSIGADGLRQWGLRQTPPSKTSSDPLLSI